MSENRIPNEQDLWDVLNEPVAAESKTTKPAPRTGAKYAKDEPVNPDRRIDGFFLTCMAGVAAVSVAATLVLGGMLGGEKPPAVQNPAVSTAPSEQSGTPAGDVRALEQENADLRQQVELQKQQIKDLRAQLLDLTGSSAEATTGSTDSTAPGQTEPDAQAEAYDLFHRIQAAYDDFDRATLEELIPQMDKLLGYLSSDALNEYYLILEYVEMPSNG